MHRSLRIHCKTHTNTQRSLALIFCKIKKLSDAMGWLRSVGSIKSWVSFAEYRLFYRALLQKRPIILSILRIEAHIRSVWNGWYTHIPLYKPLFEDDRRDTGEHATHTCIHTCVHTNIYISIHSSIHPYTHPTHTHTNVHTYTPYNCLSPSLPFHAHFPPDSHTRQNSTKTELLWVFCKRVLRK